MAATSALLHNSRRLFELLRERPHYVFGRFAMARDAYSGLRSARDLVGGGQPMRIGDLYQPTIADVAVAPSGMLVDGKSSREQVAEMRAQSYSLGPSLTPAAVATLVSEARARPLYAQGAATPCGILGTLTAEQRNQFAFASVGDASSIPAIRALAGDPALHDAARLFLRYRPREVSIWLFWSFANHLSAEHRRSVYQTIDYHYDVDGMNFMYANFYLLDTTRMNGAHAIIAGSHRRKGLRQLIGVARIGDDEAKAIYGADAERVIEGPAGSGFLEDTSCYHKALPPQTGDRLMLQLRYR